MRQQSFPVSEFPTKGKLSAHLESRISLVNQGGPPVLATPIMRQLIERYEREYLPELSKSTRDTDGSMLRLHIRPRWGDTLISDVTAGDVEAWCKSLSFGTSSKGRARRLLKQLIDRAMVWGMVPVGVNPISLVRIRGVSLRAKRISIVSVRDAGRLIAALPQPYSLMVLLAAGLGLRSEEIIALRWEDFDFALRTVTIARAYTHGEVKETKTTSSAATLPLEGALHDDLLSWRENERHGWLFPSPMNNRPLRADMVLRSHIHPVIERLCIAKFGWHALRHSYKSWQGLGRATPAVLRDLMRHSNISTTMDVYGGTQVEAMRPYVAAVLGQLRDEPQVVQ